MDERVHHSKKIDQCDLKPDAEISLELSESYLSGVEEQAMIENGDIKRRN